jgi:DNA-binding response OmpR family regulator
MPHSADALAGSTVLLVEQDGFVAGYVASVLEAAGGQILGPFSSSREALASFRRRTFIVNAALLNIPLGTGGGLIIADELALADVPIIFTTDHTGLSLPPRFSHCSMLPKPFAAYQVVEELIRITRYHATAQE